MNKLKLTTLIPFLALLSCNSGLPSNENASTPSGVGINEKDTFIRTTFIDTNYRPFLKRKDSLIIFEHKAIIINPSVPDTETVYDINYVYLKRRVYTDKEKQAANNLFNDKSFADFKKEFSNKAKTNAPDWLNINLWAELVKYENEFYVLDIERGYLKFDGKYIFKYHQNTPGYKMAIHSLEEASSRHQTFTVVTDNPFNSKNQIQKMDVQVKLVDKKRNLLIVKITGPDEKQGVTSIFVPYDSLTNYKHINANFLLNDHAARSLYELEFEKINW